MDVYEHNYTKSKTSAGSIYMYMYMKEIRHRVWANSASSIDGYEEVERSFYAHVHIEILDDHTPDHICALHQPLKTVPTSTATGRRKMTDCLAMQ